MNAVVKPQSEPSFRPMREEDLAAVMAIEEVAYDFPWTYGIFADCLRAGYVCWVMTLDDAVIGYGILSCAVGEAHILNICIGGPHRRAGFGRRLLARLTDLARWYQSEKMFLEVRPSNYAALSMYQRSGFRVVGRRPNYYPDHGEREDALIMTMDLKREPKPS